MVDESCIGCFFLSRGNNGGKGVFSRMCDYLLITDHARPCKSGEGCTERIPMTGTMTINEKRRAYKNTTLNAATFKVGQEKGNNNDK